MTSVCIVVQNHYDVDPRVRRKAEALVAAGYSVDVLALRLPGGKKAYTLGGVNVYTFSLGKNRGSLARYAFEYAAFFLWAFVRVPLQMRRRQYAVIDVNTLPDFLIFAPVLARWMGARLVLDMHEITPEFYMSKYGLPADAWRIRVLQFLERVSFNFADRVITINEPIQDLLVQRGLPPAKSTVIMNAADEARFGGSSPSPLTEGTLTRQKEEAPAHRKFVMMYHGTLTRIYGLDIAIEAFAMAQHEMPGAELWILGSGPEQRALVELADRRGVRSKMTMPGHLPSAEIPGWLAKCDVGVLPIRRDIFLDLAFPNKLPEFIISGKAVIVSRLKAIGHYFSDGSLAYFEPNSPSAMAEQMIRLHRDRELRFRLAATAKGEYKPIRWALMKQRYLKLVEDEARSSGRFKGLREPTSPREDVSGTEYAAKRAGDLR